MIVFLLIVVPALFPIVATLVQDPAPGVTTTKEEARNMDCTRLSEAGAHERYPGLVGEPAPRGDYIETDVVVCEKRIMSYGERPSRDEAILSELTRAAAEIAQAASARAETLGGDKTWLVDAFYPDQPVATKISFATKNALVELGLKVSDRIPVLAAGDILVVGKMEPEQAYPLACRRYFSEGSLADGEVFLAVVLRDPRETILHAGLCARGEWQWLR